MRIIAVLAVLIPTAAFAQGMPAHQHGAAMPSPAAAMADTPATTAFREAMATMHRDMDIRYTNNVEVDFLRGMIPHHQAAVAMARILLDNSQDPELRQLAEGIVSTQEAEIAQMRAALGRLGAATN